MLDQLLGLPAHPLLVHLPVVLLPLVALGVVALAVRPAWRPRYAGLVLVFAIVGALGAVGAMVTGNDLATRVGTPSSHQALGTALAVGSVVFVAVVGPWLWRVRKVPADQATAGQATMGWISAALAVVLVGLTVLTGHSGATAVWGGTTSAAPPATDPTTTPPAPADTPSTTPEPSASESTPEESDPAVPEESEPVGYTMDDVAAHDSEASCWAAIDGNVYDLTEWIGRHPGGSQRILPLCGTDATAAFSAQHGGQARPASELATFLLGPLLG